MTIDTTIERQADATRIRTLRRCLSQRHFGVQYQGPDLSLALSENLPEDWPADDGVAERVAEIRRSVLAGNPSASTEIEVYTDGSRHLQEVSCTPDMGPNGSVVGVITVIADVTETRERETAITNLLREVSHRSKNLLAIVLSIAAQTANHAGSPEDFLEKFRGRVEALASTQDLVTASNWLGTPFQSLVMAQLARAGQASLDAVRLNGDNPTLGPNASLHVGLAIHELVTNAILHGALSPESPGRIRMGATLEQVGDGDLQLVIEWRETLSAAGNATLPHFGTIVLEHIVPRSLGGEAEFSIDGDRVRYRLTVPGDQFSL